MITYEAASNFFIYLAWSLGKCMNYLQNCGSFPCTKVVDMYSFSTKKIIVLLKGFIIYHKWNTTIIHYLTLPPTPIFFKQIESKWLRGFFRLRLGYTKYRLDLQGYGSEDIGPAWINQINSQPIPLNLKKIPCVIVLS